MDGLRVLGLDGERRAVELFSLLELPALVEALSLLNEGAEIRHTGRTLFGLLLTLAAAFGAIHGRGPRRLTFAR